MQLAEFRGEFTEFRGEIRGEFTEFRGEIRGELSEFRGGFTAIQGEFTAIRDELHLALAKHFRQTIFVLIGFTLAMWGPVVLMLAN